MKTAMITGCLIALLAVPAGAAKKTLVDEGRLLDGVEGRVRKVDNVDVWQFVPTGAVVLDAETTLAAGQALALLPCSVLEQMTSLAGEDASVPVRLWALFTVYEDNNYLYSVFFLPMKAPPPPGADGEDAPPPAEEDSIIPTDILKQIKESRTPDLKKFEQLAAVTGDVNLINRTGYLRQEGKLRFFQPDAFGRNVDRSRYRLLPCGTLTETAKQMDQTPGRQRYNVSGLVTVYKGRRYILLRRSVRTHTHGNFTP